ncbi:hypothetical protein [Bacillus sp. RO1]|uniref:hypothetical protein n=1 Tax=Bacillus sp. RO1 TaxID=2722703 RepID=UPI00145735BA|nr:hypothetical protein [Bacillus sp. RO1]NLP49850.1 hypothetical protein [Bacillus sp. RO1]
MAEDQTNLNDAIQVKHENLKILQASIDRFGSYLMLEVALADGRIKIRWGLDAEDYVEIRNIIKENYFDSLEGEYHYELLPYVGVSLDQPNGKQKFLANLRCVQGKKAARIEFECSDRFAGNMEWFKKDVRCLQDLEHLKWEKFKA